MDNFCNIYDFCSLMKVPTFHKNPRKPTCIDLMLTNNQQIFITHVLSDFHKIIITIMKITYCKQEPKITPYMDYKIFSIKPHL